MTRFWFFVVVIEIQASEFPSRTILRRGIDFAFYLDPFAKVYPRIGDVGLLVAAEGGVAAFSKA